MSVHQPEGDVLLSRDALLAELESARQHIFDLEADCATSRTHLMGNLARYMLDGVSLLNPQGVHLDVNPALCAMVGFTPEELVGAGVPHPYWPPEERALLEEDLRRHFEGESETVKTTFMRKNGERFPALVTPSRVRDKAGDLAYIFATIKDVSEQRRAEEALRESEEHYRAVVENAPVGMFQSTREGQYVYVNPEYAAIFGYDTPAEMIEIVNRSGVGEAVFVEPCERRGVVQGVRDANGSWIAFETSYRRKDGGDFIGLTYVCERRDPTTGRAGLFGFVQDTTAQRAAARAVERSARLLSHGERLAHLGSWEWDVVNGFSTVSEEWQRIHGIEGERLSDEEIFRVCHEDDRKTMRAALEEVAATGGLYRVNHRIVHPDTQEIRYLKTNGEPVFDQDGRLEQVIGASLDITDSVHADMALREREERLQTALDATVAALGATVALRDPYTAGHERGTAQLACLIAERLTWSAEAIKALRTATLVHDLGKTVVPAEILSKPARLTEAEFELVKTHSQAAHDILAPIAFDGPVADIVLQHHERLDGTGYPRGLRGDEILPEARVLAVADVVEAMTSHRPYRPAHSVAEAMAELRSGLGTRYDAEAVGVCLTLLEEQHPELLVSVGSAPAAAPAAAPAT